MNQSIPYKKSDINRRFYPARLSESPHRHLYYSLSRNTPTLRNCPRHALQHMDVTGADLSKITVHFKRSETAIVNMVDSMKLSQKAAKQD